MRKKVVIIFMLLLLTPMLSASTGVVMNPKNYSSFGVQIAEAVASAVNTFLELTDTPASYSGQGGLCLKVNGAEDAIEFAACGGSGGKSGDTDYLYNNSNTMFFNETKLNSSIDIRASDINVNSSDYWDDLGTINATQMEDSNGELNILESWIQGLITAYNYITSTNVAFYNQTNHWEDNQNFTKNITVGGVVDFYYNGSDLIIE